MLQWTIVFIIVALIGAIFGFSGIARESADIGKVVAAFGCALAIVTYMYHRQMSCGWAKYDKTI